MSPSFDVEAAKKASYTDEEIENYLASKPQRVEPEYEKPPGDAIGNIVTNFKNFAKNLFNPTGKEINQEKDIDESLLKNVQFDVEAAKESKYTNDEINDYLQQIQPKKSFLEKTGRAALQLGTSALESKFLPYEFAVAPLASKEAQLVPYRESLGEDLDHLTNKKASGNWNEEDQQEYDRIVAELEDPSESMKNIQTANLSLRSGVEKLTGVDMTPEGTLEKAASWLGYLKDPKKGLEITKNLYKNGIQPQQLMKAILPGTKTLNSLGAGYALEMAEEGEFGPLGTMGVAMIGHAAGHIPEGFLKLATNPKATTAKIINALTMNNTKRATAIALSDGFKESGLDIDLGTLTDSEMVKFVQARVSQSGLTGKAADNFRKDLSGQIIREYENLANQVGELTFENNYQASEAIKKTLKVQEEALAPFEEYNTLSRRKENAKSLKGRVNTDPVKQYENEFLNTISEVETPTNYQGGETLKIEAQNIKQPIKEALGKRWSKFDERIKSINAGQQPQLANELNTFINENKGSLLLGESTAEYQVIQAAEKLRNQLMPNGKLKGNITLSDIIKTKRTLADVANFEFGGSNFESAYKHLVSIVDSAAERSMTRVPSNLIESYRNLSSDYSQFKNTFENPKLKHLFEPKNHNYNSIYNEFVKDPDSLLALQEAMEVTESGKNLVKRVKRDFAKEQLSKNNLTERDFRNLGNTLGAEYEEPLNNFIRDRNYAIENPLPKAASGKPDINVRSSGPKPQSKPIDAGRVKESANSIRSKQYNLLKDKTSDQVLSQMNTLEGIKKMKHSLIQTTEGRKLFEQLSRYKLDEMIAKKMTSSMTEQVKLGTFSGLLKESKNQAIVKELIGGDNFKKLYNLQKNASIINQGAEKFFNASKTGSSLSDMAFIGAAVTGVMTGNPWMASGAIAKIGGYRIMSNLLFDKNFIEAFDKAIRAPNQKVFQSALKSFEVPFKKSFRDMIRQEEESEEIEGL